MRLGLLGIVLASCAYLDAEDHEAFEDRDGDQAPYTIDCNDEDPGVLGAIALFTDADGDGWGDPDAVVMACELGPNVTTVAFDCDDQNASVNRDANERCDPDGVDEDCDGLVNTDDDDATGVLVWWTDVDGDGFGDGNPSSGCDLPPDVALQDGDCDDTNAAASPRATERCDVENVDEDCDGYADDLDAEGALGELTWFPDADDDLFGDARVPGRTACEGHPNEVVDDNDCDDDDPTVHPGVGERCGGGDEDCDYRSDDADDDVIDPKTWYLDADRDGHGLKSDTALACLAPSGRVASPDDCDDARDDVSPSAPEVCDQRRSDEDCDALLDDDDPTVTETQPYYADADKDGYGDANDVVLRCEAVLGRVDAAGDCNDQQPTIGPGTAEVCDTNNLDEDCDGAADDLDTNTIGKFTWFMDSDEDGHGSLVSVSWCDPPAGVSAIPDDCDDKRKDAFPGAAEIWCDGFDQACDGGPDKTTEIWYDGIDEDCDGKSDNDADRDGYDAVGRGGADCADTNGAVHPLAVEYIDGNDSDCDSKDFVCGSVTRRIPQDHATLADGVTAACAGDTLLVAPGTYAVAVNVAKAITIDGPGVTFVPAVAATPVLTASRGKYMNFTVANSTADDGGMYVRTGSNVRIEGVHFQNNHGKWAGGLQVDRSPITTIIGATFTGNSAADLTEGGGGLAIYASDTALIRDCTFLNNDAPGEGGGMRVMGSSGVLLDGGFFSGNTSGSEGGGLLIGGACPNFVVQGTVFEANVADYIGGAVQVNSVGAKFLGVTFDNNDAYSGALAFERGGGVIEDSVFLNNKAGGLKVYASDPEDLFVRRTSFQGNDYGAQITVQSAAAWTIEACDFDDNEYDISADGPDGLIVSTTLRGARARSLGLAGTNTLRDVVVTDVLSPGYPLHALDLTGDKVTLEGFGLYGSTVDGLYITATEAHLNQVVVADVTGAGILVASPGTVDVDHLTAVGNGTGVKVTSGVVHVRNAIVAHNALGWSAPSSTTATYCDHFGNTTNATGGVATSSCLASNPGFQTWNERLTPSALDLHLATGSPMFDAGDPAATDANGTRSDLGAFGGPVDGFGVATYYADVDSDGMYDGWERAHGLDPTRNDTNGDADLDLVSNLIEFAGGTSPSSGDTDGDGRTDAQERAAATDPLDPFSP